MIKNKYPTTKPSLNLDFANTKSLDPRITFRRGTPGTYYDGVTHVKAEENLIYPSIPDNNWSASGYTVTTNSTTAPDGTTTASKIVLNNTTTTASVRVDPSVSINNFYTFSIYAKAGEFSVFNLDVTNSVFGDTGINVDLSIGSIIASGSDNISSSITDVGNNWYRIVMVGKSVATGTTGYIIRNVEDTGDGSSGFYLWGAQLEQRDTVTSYTATNGAPITKYQPKLMTAPADHARFDHDPITGESKGLLIEEQRTNLIAYSEDFGNAAWIKQNGHPYESNVAVGLDGSVSATRIYKTSDQWIRYQYTQAGTYTLSCWVKSEATSGDFTMESYNPTDNSANGSDSFTATNKWKRFSRTVTIDTADGTTSWYPCVPANTNEKFYIWGAQLEKGSFATSYIKSSGATAGTVRSADNASITGENFSSWYRQDEGSLYVENSTFDTRSGSARIQFTDGTVENRMYTANGAYTLYVQTDDAIQVNLSSSLVTNQYVKKAIGLKENDFAVSIDGGDPLVDTSGRLPFVNKFGFWNNIVNSGQVNGHVKKLAYYPQRLTNEQLQNLTK